MEPAVPLLLKLIVAACLSVVHPAAQPAPVENPAPPVFAASSTSTGITVDQITADKLAIAQARAARKAELAAKTTQASASPTSSPSSPSQPGDSAASVAVKDHLHLPLDPGSYIFTSDYGPRCAPIGGVPLFHDGIDLAAPLGTPIYAIADGTVVKVVDGVNDVNTNGGELDVQATIGGQTITYIYRHMLNTTQYVKVGDTVKAGQHVSDVASTGHSTGPHLHFEIHQGTYKDPTIDPEAWTKSIGLPVVEDAKANYATHQDMSQCPSSTDTASAPPLSTASDGAPTPSAAPSTPQPVQPAPQSPVTPTPSAPKTTAPAPVTPNPTPTPSSSPSTPTITPSTKTSISVTVP